MSPARGVSSGLYGQRAPFRSLAIVVAAVLGGVIIGGLSVLGVIMAVAPSSGPEASIGSQVFNMPQKLHAPPSQVVPTAPPNTRAPAASGAPQGAAPVEMKSTGQAQPAEAVRTESAVGAAEAPAGPPAQNSAKASAAAPPGENSTAKGAEQKPTRTKAASKREWRHRRDAIDRSRPPADDDLASDDGGPADPRLVFPRPRRPIYDYDRSDRYGGGREYGNWNGFFGFGR